MAYVKSIPIKSSTHTSNAIGYISHKSKTSFFDNALAYMEDPSKTKYIDNTLDYIKNPQKTNLVFKHNCYGDNAEISKQFSQVRKNFNKDNKILAHHMVQSFAKTDDLTPKMAFEIGKTLIETIAPNFQIVLSTHTDKKHIHNHFLINSVNPMTGKKWLGNQTTLANTRSESDKLCRKYDLSVIENKKGYKGIDSDTFQLAKQGKSWKVQLVKDLKEALEVCKNKKEFIKFFKDKNYKINWSNKNITFQKIGESKSIRVDTLARQFGITYTKDNIEKTLNCFKNDVVDVSSAEELKTKNEITEEKTTTSESKTDELPKEESSFNSVEENTKKAVEDKPKKNPTPQLNEWEKLQKHFFENNASYIKFPKWTIDKILFSQNPVAFILNLIKFIFSKRKFKRVGSYKVKNIISQKSSSNKYKVQKTQNFKGVVPIGNCNYHALKNSQGNTATVTIYAHQIPLIYNSDFFFCSYVDFATGTANVTVKEKNLVNLAECLNLSDKDFFVKQNEVIKNKKAYKKIKSKENDSVEYLIVDEEQCKKLDDYFIPYAKFPKDGRINIAFNLSNKKKILSILYPSKLTKEQQNLARYRSLKVKSELNKDKLMFKLLTADEFEKFEKSIFKTEKLLYATFPKGDKTNLAYLKSDEKQINECIANFKREVSKNGTYKRP